MLKLTVYIITYNQENFIEACLLSVLQQKTTFDFEIVVTDDASTDATVQVLKKIQQNYSKKIKIVENRINTRKLHFLRELYGIKNSEYIAFLDGDDIWYEGKLQKQIEFLDKHPEIALSHHNMNVVDFNSKKILRKFNVDHQKRFYTIKELALFGHTINRSSTIIRRLSLPKVVAYKQNLINLDYILNMQIAKHGNIGYIDEVLGEYTVHENAISSSINGYMREDSLYFDFYGRRYALKQAKENLDEVEYLQAKRFLYRNFWIMFKSRYNNEKRAKRFQQKVERLGKKIIDIQKNSYPVVENNKKYFSKEEERYTNNLKRIEQDYIDKIETIKNSASDLQNFLSNFCEKKKLLFDLQQYIYSDRKTYSILCVWTGLYCNKIGSEYKDFTIKTNYIDPLANTLNALYGSIGVDPNIFHLDNSFSQVQNDYDLVVCIDGIYNYYNPLLLIENMLARCSENGYCYIRGNIGENFKTNAKLTLLRTWEVSFEEGDLLFVSINDPKHRFYLGSSLHGVAVMDIYSRQNQFVCVLKSRDVE